MRKIVLMIAVALIVTTGLTGCQAWQNNVATDVGKRFVRG
jgi:hypothetical protein